MFTQLINRQQVRVGVTLQKKDAVIKEGGELLLAGGFIQAAYIDSVLQRENVSSTYLGYGVAIPHGLLADRHLVRKTGVAVLQIPQGVDWGEGNKVYLVVMIAAHSDEHIDLLRHLTRILRQPQQLEFLFTTHRPDDLIMALSSDRAHCSYPAEAFDYTHAWQGKMIYPDGLHARPANSWVKTAQRFDAEVRIAHGDTMANAKSLIEVLSLGLRFGDVIRLKTSGPEAKEALDALRQLVEENLDSTESLQSMSQLTCKESQRFECSYVITGVGVSPGLAIGVTKKKGSDGLFVPDIAMSLSQSAREFDWALTAVQRELRELVAQTSKKTCEQLGAIFEAQEALLTDKTLIDETCRLIALGHGVAWSWQQALESQICCLKANDNRLVASREADVRDVGRRVLEKLLQHDTKNAFDSTNETILIAEDLSPSDTALLDPQSIAGLCTVEGSATSHTAILANSLGFPALVAAGASLLDVPDGTRAILDGEAGCLYIAPSLSAQEKACALLAQSNDRESDSGEYMGMPAYYTSDGIEIKLYANIDRVAQVPQALSLGAQGVGLMRSEFLFLNRAEAPTQEEQYLVYRSMVETLAGRHLVIRALDIGADKTVSYCEMPVEKNPVLGVRGTRLLLRHIDLLEAQLSAIYRASVHGPLSVMFPMVSSVKEIVALREVCEGVMRRLNVPKIPLGMMVEVPAAAVMADKLAQYVDFFSIGTNDLAQYTLAIDRQQAESAPEADVLHPAVLRLIEQTVTGASQVNVPVSVCGHLASDPMAAAILIGLGVESLSISPFAIAAVRAHLLAATHTELIDIAALALDCDSAQAVRRLFGGSL